VRLAPVFAPYTKKGDKRRIYDLKALEMKLQEVLDLPQIPPLSLNNISKNLGMDLSFLKKLFPELTSQIVNQAKEYRNAICLENKYKIREEIRNTVLSLHKENIYPSNNRVANLLSNPAKFIKGHVYYLEIIRELGYRD
jgi:hypothetical protein